jgi:hypothetical protein
MRPARPPTSRERRGDLFSRQQRGPRRQPRRLQEHLAVTANQLHELFVVRRRRRIRELMQVRTARLVGGRGKFGGGERAEVRVEVGAEKLLDASINRKVGGRQQQTERDGPLQREACAKRQRHGCGRRIVSSLSM